MMDVWENHGPPSFVGIAISIGFKSPSKKQSTKPSKHGTMADLAAMFGLGDTKKRAMI